MRDEDIADGLAIAPARTRASFVPAWWSESQRSPRQLFAQLYARLEAAARTTPKSRAGQSFDLYHDMVIRQLGSGAPALHHYDPFAPADRRWQTLAYEQLHARCTELAAAWASQGVKAGSKLA
ncbi:MAG: long-chain fatty acid--CoA ligase, partial [Deltaproteobacteria bacterium]|nr:long-chain fatty acid--CoA ligase [Deltaproteobacteria bacterium]